CRRDRRERHGRDAEGAARRHRRHHGVPRLGALRPQAQARRDERALAPDGGDARLRHLQPRPADLCRAEAQRHRAAVRPPLSLPPRGRNRTALARWKATKHRLDEAKAGPMDAIDIAFRLAGGFYLFAGWFGLRAILMDSVLDKALAALSAGKEDP